ncbi:cysteine--1-D-myo-inosityl 2-amino-2-deoxy-alpha-D-glucopyranoside ligase [Agreia sp. COWG]|uniref:cysteine--1-D-myo-inosityl 2-amino-2-deoxy-alpha-D-glucopyranoside ligase n=1 Tax=Agreia sp. COWG TaxID=2773266 RepID=UPI0019271063|nr:cysteine--1-D-myo-inosityl 2-amino-2-deoxy-alpha-D-glucopyranoside ligase [Agreia sp. COWG]CAD5997838.1 L-cysteine:1D-myo-inositol 2-amino-2-deoxy-alpha-D-glucopyranoside ligase [Agreia sp. COWG]
MKSWNRPDVPTLPGRGPIPQLFDDSRGHKVASPGTDGRAGIYVCGITPYDATHIGHASTYVAFDGFQRLWLDAGLDVDYVQNVTDVDDPLLERAAATGVDWSALAASQVDLFRADMTALRVLPPRDYVAVTDAITPIADAVGRLVDEGYGYFVETPDARVPGARDIYFDSTAAAERTSWHLGLESRLDTLSMDAFFAERGGDPDRAGKRHRLDPLLWRTAREGEPSWPSIVGEGRPGWHIECSVIALQHLGPHFGLQGGGSDLVFPHHEFSAAHATALTGEPFADAYAHAGMVAYEGEKMSKSLGNLVLVSRLRAAGVDPSAVRLVILGHHYRADWEWTDAELADAIDRLESWRSAAAVPSASGDQVEELELLDELRRVLSDDLDTPAALAAVDAWVSRASASGGLVAKAVDALLGVQL